MSKKLKVEYWDVDAVIPYASNPRNNDSAVLAVKSSIEEFGFVNPVLVDGEGVLIAGHTRLKAAVELGLKKVPVVVADHLSDKQVRAFRIIDNSTTSIAEWNEELLKLEMENLPEVDFQKYGLDIDMPQLFEKNIDAYFEQTQEYSGGVEASDEDDDECFCCPECEHEFYLKG